MKILLLVLAALPLLAQKAPDAPYLIGAGISFTQDAKPAGAGWFMTATRISDVGGKSTYGTLQFDITPRYTASRVGIEQKLIESDRWILTASGQAGIASGTNSAPGGVFGGGGSILVRLNKIPAAVGQANRFFLIHAELIQANVAGSGGQTADGHNGATAKIDIGFVVAFH